VTDLDFKEYVAICAGSKVAHPLGMTSRSLLMAAAVVLSAALIYPADSAAQRQRWPGGSGGGRQEGGGGGERQRDNGGGGARQRDGGGGRQRDDGGARRQDGGGNGNGRAEARAAQPRGEPIDRGDRGNRTRGDSGRRESPTEVRETTPPPQVQSAPPPATRSEAGSQDARTARRRFPTDADRADRGNVSRGDGNRGDGIRAEGARGYGNRDRGANGSVASDNSRVRNGSRVAVPRVGRPPQRWDDRNDRNVYGSYYGGRNVVGRYAYRGGRNIYIVPRGRTYVYYPRYYYNPYSFGYGPAGRGHLYFDLHYNSYIWHPYSVSRYGNYGSYGYPVGELRLKVHPRDAQVFIDGYYAGRVDEFDGVFQSLRLEEGEYQVEIVLPGYEPLAIDVRIFPGEKTTYEGDLIPE
jgi:hypothetical protein